MLSSRRAHLGIHCPARVLRPAALALVAVMAGCATPEPNAPRLSEAWRTRQPPQAPAAQPARDRAPDLLANKSAATGGRSVSGRDEVIAFVDGQPVSRSRVVDLLLAGHGVGILEQVIVLEKAKTLAAEQGIDVTPADIDTEFDRALAKLASPLPAAGDADFDRAAAEQVLSEVLSRRNLSRAEYLAMVERNAYLRAICHGNMEFTAAQYREEYQRAFGPRVQIRHIQLASLSEAEHVHRLLQSGRDFATVAEAYSANLRTAPSGGLLRPLARDDTDAPRALVETAFKMREGENSAPIRAGDWFHVIRLERHLPADERTIDQVRGALERRLRDRYTEPAMQTLYRSLFEQAEVRVTDDILAEEFTKKHPNHR
jgi:foldase protein PrsA